MSDPKLEDEFHQAMLNVYGGQEMACDQEAPAPGLYQLAKVEGLV